MWYCPLHVSPITPSRCADGWKYQLGQPIYSRCDDATPALFFQYGILYTYCIHILYIVNGVLLLLLNLYIRIHTCWIADGLSFPQPRQQNMHAVRQGT